VAQAYAQAQSAATRTGEAEAELKDAVESADKNLQGLTQTNAAARGRIVLLVRTQEVIASIQALGQAYTDYFGAIADYDRARFRLYRVLGRPAQAIARRGWVAVIRANRRARGSHSSSEHGQP
jgi:hypothetical protein